MRPVRVDLDMTDEEAEYFIGVAIESGWKRIDPRVRWRDGEHRDFIRRGVEIVLRRALDKAKNKTRDELPFG